MRKHTHLSNRQKDRTTLEKRTVLKNALGNPFRLQWPTLNLDTQQNLFSKLLDYISCHLESSLPSTSKKRRRSKPSDTSAARTGPKSDQHKSDNSGNAGSSATANSKVDGHFVVGINEVTRALEMSIASRRRLMLHPKSSSNSDGSPYRPCRIVFVCLRDIDPPFMVWHIPRLVASFNSIRSPGSLEHCHPVSLVALPKGAELKIAKALGIRRAAALALRVDAPGLDVFQELLETAGIMTSASTDATSRSHRVTISPTHIKQMRTTAVKDIKAAKDRRTKGRVAAKVKREGHKRRTIITGVI